ncbi:MAG: hypothetical protein V7785_18505 [Bermanella sp.]
MKNIALYTTFLTCLTLTYSLDTRAEAFCALRDPVASIYQLYPEATSFRSIVRTVNKTTRSHVINHLPNMSLHFSEMGRHTLYVALKNEKELGYVHVRSEKSQWGLVEVAWALNLDLSIHDFTFQRARNPSRRFIETHEFKSQLTGRNFSAMKTLINQPFAEHALPLFSDKDALQLASVVIQSGLKTLLITEQTWKSDLIDQSQLD